LPGTVPHQHPYHPSPLTSQSHNVAACLTGTYRFDITPGGQQIHIAFGVNDDSLRHPCFRVESPEALVELQRKIWTHFEKKDAASPTEVDKPGEASSGKFEIFVFLSSSPSNREPFSWVFGRDFQSGGAGFAEVEHVEGKGTLDTS
jgi:hypothetical protein